MAKRQAGREHWPKGMAMPRPGYYCYTNPKGVTRSIGLVSEPEAIEAAIDMADRFKSAAIFAQLKMDDQAAYRMKDRAYYWATSRAKDSGRALMGREEFEVMWERSGARCELTGIAFSPRPVESVERIWPWHPSIDRIDNSDGYTFSNSRLVCVAMNMAMHEFGEHVFVTLARCFVERRFGARSVHEASTPAVS